MSTPKKVSTTYNLYSPKGSFSADRGWKTTILSDATKQALEELAEVKTWARFVEICDKQKRKRGW